MPQQNIEAGDTGAVARAKINGNATELYAAVDDINEGMQARILARGLGC